jgi:hypothetical protein
MLPIHPFLWGIQQIQNVAAQLINQFHKQPSSKLEPSLLGIDATHPSFSVGDTTNPKCCCATYQSISQAAFKQA